MKVWVVLVEYDYEGFGDPEGVYASEAAAQDKKAALLGGDDPPDGVGIFELEVSGLSEAIVAPKRFVK